MYLGGLDMNKKISVIFIAVGCLLLIIGIGAGYYIYHSNHPDISISIGGDLDDTDGDYVEHITIAIGGHANIPIADTIENKLIEIGDWNSEAVEDLLNNYQAPRNIVVSGEVKDGKTILRYEGEVTTKEGKIEAYLNEKEFNFVLVPGEKLLK